MSSSPDVMETVSVAAETDHVQAGVWRVRRFSVMGTSRPPWASAMTGVTTMSLLRQAPVGSASGGSVGVFFFLRFFFFTGSVGAVSLGEVVVGAPAVAARSSPLSEASLEPPRSSAKPTTSSRAMPEQQQPTRPVDARRQRAAGQGEAMASR